jgi:hypothetical protein
MKEEKYHKITYEITMALAMINVALTGNEKKIVEVKDIKILARKS